jgi:hypothetical protein
MGCGDGCGTWSGGVVCWRDWHNCVAQANAIAFERKFRHMTPPPLISTGLQPGVPAGEEPSRFNGLAPAPGLRSLKRFHPSASVPTRLKPSASERAMGFARANCQSGGLTTISRRVSRAATTPRSRRARQRPRSGRSQGNFRQSRPGCAVPRPSFRDESDLREGLRQEVVPCDAAAFMLHFSQVENVVARLQGA